MTEDALDPSTDPHRQDSL